MKINLKNRADKKTVCNLKYPMYLKEKGKNNI